MKAGINFTPGPSQLYFTVEDHMRRAFREGIPSLSHRSKSFEGIVQQAVHGLKELLSIPDDFHIVFTSSATEVWERLIQNLVIENSAHFINGAFSKRFYEIALQLNRHAELIEVTEGEGFTSTVLSVNPELIALTHNETSTGVSLSMEFINSFREKYPTALISVDAVSSLPYPLFDFSKIDSLYFSVQKGFGLPAGLGVWIVNDKCVVKAEHILSQGISIGSYHSLTSLVTHARKNQTPETPNVLGIYLLSNVIQDLLRRGITTIRRETEYKAAILYNALEQHDIIHPFVTNRAFQSKTVIVADTGEFTSALTAYLQEKGIFPGEGYGKLKTSQLRFANFPAHSKEQFELLVDLLMDFSG
jgi:phosphoserine aminotransferase